MAASLSLNILLHLLLFLQRGLEKEKMNVLLPVIRSAVSYTFIIGTKIKSPRRLNVANLQL